MKNPLRSLTLIAALSLTLLPLVAAENIGTDPKPRATLAVAQRSMVEQLEYAVFYFFGL